MAEAAAIFAGGSLLVGKRKSNRDVSMATGAIARHQPRGRLAIIGLGPGARDLLTPRAKEELRRAAVIVGLDQYVEQIEDLLRPGTRLLATGLGNEEERARSAIVEAKKVMQWLLLVLVMQVFMEWQARPWRILTELSMLWECQGLLRRLQQRLYRCADGARSLFDKPFWICTHHGRLSNSGVKAAAVGDFVVSFYNPRSKGRAWQLDSALVLLAEHRPATTPVGLVRAASRSSESVTLTTLTELITTGTAAVDMFTLVVVGNSSSKFVDGQMVTPRGYDWKS